MQQDDRDKVGRGEALLESCNAPPSRALPPSRRPSPSSPRLMPPPHATAGALTCLTLRPVCCRTGGRRSGCGMCSHLRRPLLTSSPPLLPSSSAHLPLLSRPQVSAFPGPRDSGYPCRRWCATTLSAPFSALAPPQCSRGRRSREQGAGAREQEQQEAGAGLAGGAGASACSSVSVVAKHNCLTRVGCAHGCIRGRVRVGVGGRVTKCFWPGAPPCYTCVRHLPLFTTCAAGREHGREQMLALTKGQCVEVLDDGAFPLALPLPFRCLFNAFP